MFNEAFAASVHRRHPWLLIIILSKVRLFCDLLMLWVPAPAGGYEGRTHRGDVRLIVGVEVTSEQCAELQRVQLEAGVLDVLRILDRVLAHGEEQGCLKPTG